MHIRTAIVYSNVCLAVCFVRKKIVECQNEQSQFSGTRNKCRCVDTEWNSLSANATKGSRFQQINPAILKVWGGARQNVALKFRTVYYKWNNTIWNEFSFFFRNLTHQHLNFILFVFLFFFYFFFMFNIKYCDEVDNFWNATDKRTTEWTFHCRNQA